MPIPPDPVQRANARYVEEQHRRWLEDRTSVPEDWQWFFAGFEFAGAVTPAASAALPSGDTSGGVVGLVTAYREFGHLIARVDPLHDPPATHPLLELSNFGLSEADLDRPVDPRPFQGEARGTLRDLIDALRRTYGGTLGVEYTEIPDKRRRDWLQERLERGHDRPEPAPDERVRMLEKLLIADGLEQFLHVRYVGQKRFSLEGATALIPMLDALIERTSALGVEQLAIGMPHRGRLNVLVNVLGKPLERVFAEFETGFVPEHVQGHGDVKYHMGYSSRRESRDGRIVHLNLHYNPSHLEFVNPVVLGSVRAKQALMNDTERSQGWPVLIHGDASFAGEGIVAETLTLAQLPAYQVGGTVHVIVNNQIGFTTSPEEGRPTHYCTDIAKVVEAPVLHVNGDDPDAAVRAMRLAADYRAEFQRDVFVDLVCYRLHGHNELDDPTFTQPVMYRAIAAHPPVSRSYAERLVREGVLDEQTVKAMESEISQRLNAAHRRAKGAPAPAEERTFGGAWQGLRPAGEDWSAKTSVSRATLEQVVRSAARLPQGFHPHPKAAKLLEERIAMVQADRIDWGAGELLALGTLLLEGYHVRLSGQDSARGTFSHRHAALHDSETGARHVPLQHLAPGQGRFEVINTMLSEAAVVGFEYGYSTADPHTLVIWESQYGDFANVAQVYIDQFLASSESKWHRMSGITLLLPHGYEGQGPEHSSGRIERFLELCANGNLQVCNLTTPAQLFHALRRQMHRDFRKPLVIMTPKSLLRHKRAVSAVTDFTGEGFHTVIDDASVTDPRPVRSVLLTSGKLAFALEEARPEADKGRVAIVRVEQLYPFPRAELSAVFGRYAQARDVRWVQEEPANMGAWRHVRHRIESILPEGSRLLRVARKASSSPATGYYPMHVEQEQWLLARSFDPSLEGAESRTTGAMRPGGAR